MRHTIEVDVYCAYCEQHATVQIPRYDRVTHDSTLVFVDAITRIIGSGWTT